jgi:uncharacterized cupin superfamily protein
MTSEARLQRTDAGLVPAEDGWFVVNARKARWQYGEGRGARLTFEGEPAFPQVGISLFVLAPGEPIGMYHWEADQEDFLVLSGEALLIIEGEERPLRQWDFVHCPAETKHIIVGAGGAPCAVVGVGAREHQAGADWGGYSVDGAALRHGAGVERETNDAGEAYARVPSREPIGYRHGWLSESRVVPSGADYFLVERAKGPAWDHSRGRREQTGWDEHAAFMDELAEEGFVVLGGPVGEGDGDDALLVVDADSEATVRARLADDPWPDDLLTVRSIRPWAVWVRAVSRSG